MINEGVNTSRIAATVGAMILLTIFSLYGSMGSCGRSAPYFAEMMMIDSWANLCCAFVRVSHPKAAYKTPV